MLGTFLKIIKTPLKYYRRNSIESYICPQQPGLNFPEKVTNKNSFGFKFTWRKCKDYRVKCGLSRMLSGHLKIDFVNKLEYWLSSKICTEK